MSHDESYPRESLGEASRFTAHMERGWHLLENGDLDGAQESASQARELNADDPDAAVLLAAVSLAGSEPDRAAHWYNEAITLDPEFIEPRLALANVLLFELNKPVRARKLILETRELEEVSILDRIELTVLEVEALHARGRKKRARRLLRESPDITMLSELTHDALAARSDDEGEPATLGKLSPGIRHYLQSLAGDDDYEEEFVHFTERMLHLSRRSLMLHLEVGLVDECEAACSKLVELLPDDLDLLQILADSQFAQKHPGQAVATSLKMLSVLTDAALPKWFPSDDELATWCEEGLSHPMSDLFFNSQDENQAFSVHIVDVPALELLLEGHDPRRVVHVGLYGGQNGETPQLSGICVYRKVLAHLGHNPAAAREAVIRTIHDELVHALFGEMMNQAPPKQKKLKVARPEES